MAWMRFRKKDIPGGLWTKCPSCSKTLFNKELEENVKVCTHCDHHFSLTADERVRFTLDEGTFREVDGDMSAVDALGFVDTSTYAEKIERNQKKTGHQEAMVIGTGRLRGREVVFGALEFRFLGGSMGVVVGEKVTRAAELALARRLPLILVAASGGARMHEGALSLMQMAKSCAAVGRLHAAGGLYLSILAHPTTGGVTASWATMADVILAEPKALIGFAGPRVIQTTIRQDLPEGFQRSEFLLEKGQLDRIVPRPRMVDELAALMEFCLGPVSGDAGAGPEVRPGAAPKADPAPSAEADPERRGSPPDAVEGGAPRGTTATH